MTTLPAKEKPHSPEAEQLHSAHECDLPTQKLKNELKLAMLDLERLLAELEIQKAESIRCKNITQQLSKKCLTFDELFVHAPIGYLVVDAFLQIWRSNPVATNIISPSIDGTLLPLYFAPRDRETLKTNIESVCADGNKVTFTATALAQDGTEKALTLHLSAVSDSYCGKNLCSIALETDNEPHENRKQLQKARDFLQHLATLDPLTQIPNRRALTDIFRECLENANRNHTSLAVLMLDFDRFKYINDTYGHKFGDDLLIQTAARFKRAIEEHDFVFRLGGDEFVILMTSIESDKKLTQRLESIQHISKIPYQIEGRNITSSLSVGVSQYPNDGSNQNDLMRYAGFALHNAKSSGRNCICQFTPTLKQKLNSRINRQKDIQCAIKRNEFEVWFQPIIDLETLSLRGVEALARWKHPLKGVLGPDNFIAAAEKSGAIEPLGYALLTDACEKLVEMSKRLENPNLFLSVNISPNQLCLPDFAKRVTEITNAAQLDQTRLEIELTEKTLLEDDLQSIGMMKKLQSQGIGFSIDDFGTGHSSFERLKQLPISRIKIDRSFIKALPFDTENRAIVQTMVSICTDLGLGIICEGVESQPQINFLESIGCKYVQGYLTGKPVKPELVEANAL